MRHCCSDRGCDSADDRAPAFLDDDLFYSQKLCRLRAFAATSVERVERVDESASEVRGITPETAQHLRRQVGIRRTVQAFHGGAMQRRCLGGQQSFHAVLRVESPQHQDRRGQPLDAAIRVWIPVRFERRRQSTSDLHPQFRIPARRFGYVYGIM